MLPKLPTLPFGCAIANACDVEVHLIGKRQILVCGDLLRSQRVRIADQHTA